MAYLKTIALFLRPRNSKSRRPIAKPPVEETNYIVRPSVLSKEEMIVRSLYSLK